MAILKNSRVLRVIPLLITICIFSLPAYAKYSGSIGEPNDPYQISTVEDLMLAARLPKITTSASS